MWEDGRVFQEPMKSCPDAKLKIRKIIAGHVAGMLESGVFRNTMIKLLEAPVLEYKKLTAA